MERERKRELERQFPGWQIWVTGSTWCAQSALLINADSTEELAERIRTAHSRPPDGSPSLASWRSYTARTAALRSFEEACGAAWQRMRAVMDARPRPPCFPAIRTRVARPELAHVAPSPAEPGMPDIIA